MNKNYVTGATGFLGSHLVLQLLQQEEPVIALARGEDPRSRVLSALTRASSYIQGGPAEAGGAGLSVVPGDLRLPNCGLDAIEGTGGIFWHLAANLRYHERHRAGIWEDNVDGTREAVRLAASLGCRRFVYVSTAYTAGRRTGRIREELHDGDVECNNVYEESKSAAEHVVVQHAEAANMEWVITRPSIVIGPSGSWSSGGSNSGLYGVVHRVRALRVPLRSHEDGIRLRGVPGMPLNVVPVDWVIRDLLAFGRDPGNQATIAHLTSESSVTIREIVGFVTSSLNVPPIVPIEGELSQPITIEKQLARQMEFYGNYLQYPKTFERSAAPQVIEPHQVEQAIKNFVEEIEADRTRKPAIW
jgi:nucleoside-diphosphate-sugar epimerase